MHRYRKVFDVARSKKYISESEINETKNFFNKLKKSLISKNPRDNIDSVYYEDLNDYDEYPDEYADDDKYRKIGSVRTLFKGFDSDYYKLIITDCGYDGRDDNYIKYRSNGDKHKNSSPKEYLNLIRPYLRDLINDHKSTAELNNSNNNTNNNNSNNTNNNANNSNNSNYSNSNNNNKNNKNKNKNMHREIRAFLQHCVGHFYLIQRLHFPQHDQVLRWAIFPVYFLQFNHKLKQQGRAEQI